MRKIVVAIGGSSGSIYAKMLLSQLSAISNNNEIEVSVVMTENAKLNWTLELKNSDFENLPFKMFHKNDFYAPFASGSALYDTMIICPCSMGLLGRIANGISDDLITRSADVMLKERRKLILVLRETPYNLIHINNMKSLTESGAIICPATPSFYTNPQTIEDLVMTVVDRILDLTGFHRKTFRWGENEN